MVDDFDEASGGQTSCECLCKSLPSGIISMTKQTHVKRAHMGSGRHLENVYCCVFCECVLNV